MKRKILILNPNHNLDAFFDIFEALSLREFQFLLLSRNDLLLKRFQENKWEINKIFFWPNVYSNFSLLISILLLPVILPLVFAFLLYYKNKKKINAIIISDFFDIVFLSPVAKILKIEVIRLVYPDIIASKNKLSQKETASNQNFSSPRTKKFINPKILLNFLTKCFSKSTKILCITQSCHEFLLKQNYKTETIQTIAPGIRTEIRHQENLFEKMAEINRDSQSKKFFTLGTILELNNNQNLEIIFQAIKKVLTVIPNLQLMIIGDGPEKKRLDWLAKKIGIGNLTWFVGKQNNLTKWLNNLDIYLVSTTLNNLTDINNTLYAMNEFLPVITPTEKYWQEIIENEKNGIILENFNSDILSQEIIRLNQNHDICQMLGKNAKETIDKKHRIDIVVAQLIEGFK